MSGIKYIFICILNVQNWYIKISCLKCKTVYLYSEKNASRSNSSERNVRKAGEAADSWVSRWVVRSRESKAFEESATYETNEDGPSFEQRDFHEYLWGGRKRHRRGGGHAKGRAKSHDEKNERARTQLLQDEWMGLLAMWNEGCCGEAELPAIVVKLIIVYIARGFAIRYGIMMAGLWMLKKTGYIKENFYIVDKENNASQFKRIIKLIIIIGNFFYEMFRFYILF